MTKIIKEVLEDMLKSIAISAFSDDKRMPDDYIAAALKEIEAIMSAAKPAEKDQQAQSTLEDESRCRFYRYGGYNFAIDEYERNLQTALYGKDEK